MSSLSYDVYERAQVGISLRPVGEWRGKSAAPEQGQKPHGTCQIVAKGQLGQAMLRVRGQAEGCNEANVLAKLD